MDQRDDYAELDAPRPWFLRFLVRRALPIGLVVLLAGAAAVVIFGIRVSDRHYETYKSIDRAVTLAECCQHKMNRDGKYPAKLSDLGEFLAGEYELSDAWGNPFRYAVVPNEAGGLEPYVWTERTRDAKTILVGAKVKADGTIVRFGLPDDD